jgi:antitoxin MazE
MQVGKWGNSLAVRLPAAVVEALDLKEGDEIEIEVADPNRFRLARDTRREEALETLRRLGWHLRRTTASTVRKRTAAANEHRLPRHQHPYASWPPHLAKRLAVGAVLRCR